MIVSPRLSSIPWFDGAVLSLEWSAALWDRHVTGASRPRTPPEQQASDRQLRSRRCTGTRALPPCRWRCRSRAARSARHRIGHRRHPIGGVKGRRRAQAAVGRACRAKPVHHNRYAARPACRLRPGAPTVARRADCGIAPRPPLCQGLCSPRPLCLSAATRRMARLRCAGGGGVIAIGHSAPC